MAESKVVAGAVAGGITAIAFWIGGYFAPDFFNSAPPGMEATVAATIAALAAYFKPDRTHGSSLR